MDKVISYWKEYNIAHYDEKKRFYVIYGKYNHLNNEEESRKCLGLHWEDYPKSRSVLAPMVVTAEIKNSILAGLLKDGLDKKNKVDLEKILKAIEYFKDEDLKDSY